MSLEQFYPNGTDLTHIQEANFRIKGFADRTQFTPSRLNCPFCLYQGSINDFIDSRDGTSKHRVCKCPDCKNTLRRKTLVRTSTMTLEQYAHWLYWTRRYDIDRKIKWDRLFPRMKDLRIANEFWPLYRAVKESDTTRNNQPARDYSVSSEF